MSRTTKLILDILMGAVIPILVLNNLTGVLGAVPTYLLAALIPVGWVFVDLLFISRQFNFITSYTGAQAIMRGLLAFWFVDGWQFALKDTAGSIVACLVFAASLLVRRPMMELFWRQGLAPDTPERERAIDAVTREAGVHRALLWGTAVILLANIGTAVANYILNLQIVLSPFGTEAFNQEVARVNAITRIALTIPELIAFGVAFWLLWQAVAALLKTAPESVGQKGDEFWDPIVAWAAGQRQEAGGRGQEAGGRGQEVNPEQA